MSEVGGAAATSSSNGVGASSSGSSAPSSTPSETASTATPGAAPEMQSTATKRPKYTVNERGKYVVPHNGAEIEVDLDEALDNYQYKRLSQARLEEAARMKKQATKLFADLKEAARKGDRSTMRQVMQKLGYDPRSFSEAELNEAFRQERMTPEQRRAQELDLKERELMTREQKLAKEAHEREVTMLERQYAKEAEVRAPAALKAAGVPQTAWHLRRLATLMSESIGTDSQLSYEDAASIVAEEYREEFDAHMGGLAPDDLLKLIGEERMKEIRRRDLDRVRNGGAPPSPSELAPARSGPAKPKAPPMTTDAYFKKLRRSI